MGKRKKHRPERLRSATFHTRLLDYIRDEAAKNAGVFTRNDRRDAALFNVDHERIGRAIADWKQDGELVVVEAQTHSQDKATGRWLTTPEKLGIPKSAPSRENAASGLPSRENSASVKHCENDRFLPPPSRTNAAVSTSPCLHNAGTQVPDQQDTIAVEEAAQISEPTPSTPTTHPRMGKGVRGKGKELPQHPDLIQVMRYWSEHYGGRPVATRHQNRLNALLWKDHLRGDLLCERMNQLWAGKVRGFPPGCEFDLMKFCNLQSSIVWPSREEARESRNEQPFKLSAEAQKSFHDIAHVYYQRSVHVDFPSAFQLTDDKARERWQALYDTVLVKYDSWAIEQGFIEWMGAKQKELTDGSIRYPAGFWMKDAEGYIQKYLGMNKALDEWMAKHHPKCPALSGGHCDCVEGQQ